MKKIIVFIGCFFLNIFIGNKCIEAVNYLENKTIYNVDIGLNAIVYEYEENLNGVIQHYVGYYDSLNKSFIRIKSNDDEDINSDMLFPSISDDDKYITFTTSATNVTEDDVGLCSDIINNISNYCSNVYLYDLIEKKSFIIKDGNNLLNGNSYISKISGDGKSVVFESSATNNLNYGMFDNCISNGINICINIFKYSISNKVITAISTKPDNYGGNANSISPSISYDGRYIVFQSSATNFIDYSTYKNYCKNINNDSSYLCSNIYLVDTKKSQMKVVSSNNYELFNDNSGNAYISSYGDYVIYESYATNIENIYNNKQHIVLYNILTSQNIIISKTEKFLNNRDNYLKDISKDGNLIIFFTNSTNINSTGENSLYVYNNKSQKTAFIGNFENDDIIAKINVKKLILYDSKLSYADIDNEAPLIDQSQVIYVVKDSAVLLEDKIIFNDNLFDNNEIELYLEDWLVINNVGEYYVAIKAIDPLGNCAVETIKVIVIEYDIEPPVFKEISEIRVLKGSSTLNLSNYIDAIDKVDGSMKIYIIDDGGLNLNSRGKYNIKLMSKDNSQNVSYKEIVIVVYENYDFVYYYEIILILGVLVVIIFSIIKVK